MRQIDPGGSYLDGLRRVEFEIDADVIEFGLQCLPASVSDWRGPADQALHVLCLLRERRTSEPLMLRRRGCPRNSRAW